MVMFSATWPLLVHQLAQEFMDPNPVKVVIGSEDLAANHDVMQIVEESKIYGAHFKEISVNAPKPKRTTFNDSDDD
ncbi:DEAD-box ATP-dependent RNA helicase 5 [Fagus crenata]